MNIYQSNNLAVIAISRFTIERIQPATGLILIKSSIHFRQINALALSTVINHLLTRQSHADLLLYSPDKQANESYGNHYYNN